MEIDYEILRDIDWNEQCSNSNFNEIIDGYERAGIPRGMILELLQAVFCNAWGKGWNCHVDHAKDELSDE